MRVLIALCFLSIAGIGLRPAAGLAQTDVAESRLLPGDQLLIQVKNEPNLSGRYTVGPDGAVMLPVVGIVETADRPFREVEACIRERYARELAEPDLLITPLIRVAIMGEFRAPGFQWLDPTNTLADLYVLSGGLLPTANRKGIKLVRGTEETDIRLDQGGAPPPIPLQSGDRLIVGRRSWFSENLPIFIGAAASVAAAAVTSLIVR